MTTDPDPRLVRAAATTEPVEPVTVGDIAAFTARLARLRPPARGGDPAGHAAEYAALLAHKAELFARIAGQHARTDPARAQEARGIAERAHAAARGCSTLIWPHRSSLIWPQPGRVPVRA